MIDAVHDDVSTIRESTAHIYSKLERQEDMTILNWLTPIEYGSQQSDYFRKRQQGTGKWFLDSEEYLKWLETKNQMLFCPGIPGAGKTIISAIIINDLITRFQSDPSTGIAFLYCNFQRKDVQRAEDLLSTLLKQLSRGRPVLPDSVKDLYSRHKTTQTRPAIEEISKALQSVAAIYSRVFVVVDALDECQPSDRMIFLSEISALETKHSANVLVTSRSIPQITEQFEDKTTLEIRARSDDVRVYLDGSMSRLPGFLGSDRKLQEDIQAEIAQLVEGMYVASLCLKRKELLMCL
jgi:hypothetical protein